MKLRIDEVNSEVKHVAFGLAEGAVNDLLARGPVQEYKLEGPVAVTVSYYRSGADLIFEGTLKVSAVGVCGRCAEPFHGGYERNFRFVVAPASSSVGTDSELRTEDLEFSYYSGEHIDLSPLLREQAILSLPIRPLCKESCRGLCATCGANLNLDSCRCQPQLTDSRTAGIRVLNASRIVH